MWYLSSKRIFYHDEWVSSSGSHTIININAPNNRISKCMEQKLTDLKDEIDNSAKTVGDPNTLLSKMNRTTSKKSKGNRRPQQQEKWTRSIGNTLPAKSRRHVLLTAHRTVCSRGHVLGHTTNPKKFSSHMG